MSGERRSAREKISVPRWNQVNLARVSSSKLNHADRDHGDQRDGHRDADDPGAERPPGVRQGREAGPGSESAGMDVGEQDRPARRARRARPSAAGRRRAAPSRAPPPSPRDAAARSSGPRCRGSSSTAARDVRLGRCRSPSSRRSRATRTPSTRRLKTSKPGGTVAGAGDEHRLGLEDGLAEHLEPGLPAACCRSRRRRRSTSATPSWMLVSTAPSRRTTSASMPRSSRNARTTPTYDVAIRLPASSARSV